MSYYPVYLDIENRPCLVVGGGGVGTRKAKGLLACGGRVTVVSPGLTPVLQSLADEGSIEWRRRLYRPDDLTGMFLVFGATDNEILNQQIHAEAQKRNMLCNIADRPAVCNFILPSIVRRGDLVIAISTSGKSPAFAKKLRKDLENQFGDEYRQFLHLMGAIRRQLLSREHEPEAHKYLFEALMDKGLMALLKARNTEAVKALLQEVLGEGFELERLLDGN